MTFVLGQPRPANAGRKKGTPNKRTQVLKAAGEFAIAQLKEPFEGDGYALLALVYKNQDMPLSTRMSAASMAIPYECPRLSQVDMTTRSLDRMTDEEFFRAWDKMEKFLER